MSEAFDPIKILQTIDLLSDLKADALEMLGRKMSRIRVPAGQEL